MAESRSVDPTTLIPNPNNPRRTPAPKAMDDQLVASIRAIGMIQPPVVREVDEGLMIKAGHRRVRAAITAGKTAIDVIVSDADEATGAMGSLSENLIRASMTSVDIWRATEALEQQGWNEQAIADALALPVRTIKRLKLLAHLHPPRLDLRSVHAGIAKRRRKLLDLELAMVAKCEAHAARGRAATVQMHDRETWDRSTWDRYLAAAAALEGQYGPPMRRLLREIDQLERVLALPVASDTAE